MKLLVFGQDMGQAKSLARVVVEALDRAHSVRSVLFNNILSAYDAIKCELGFSSAISSGR